MSPQVLIVIGSKSDHEVMKETAATLTSFGVESEYRVASAHRAPKLVSELATTAKKRGIKVIIAGAGAAAHLAGVIAAQTTLPVIGVPMQTSSLNGMDSLLSIVQMPSGVPVATVAIGKAGAKNAALLAVQILALADEALAERFEAFKAKQSEDAQNVSLE